MSYDEVPEPAEVDMERCGDRVRHYTELRAVAPVVWLHGTDVGHIELREDGRYSAMVYDLFRGQYRRVTTRCRTEGHARRAVLAAYRRSTAAAEARVRRRVRTDPRTLMERFRAFRGC